VVVDELINRGLLDNVKKQGAYLKSKLYGLAERNKNITDVRGIGLMLGIELDFPVRDTVLKCADKGLLLVSAGEKVIRFVPPLNVTGAEIDECIEILEAVL
jgi:4-aminobutyrate aminotransferase-like enzyme